MLKITSFFFRKMLKISLNETIMKFFVSCTIKLLEFTRNLEKKYDIGISHFLSGKINLLNV